MAWRNVGYFIIGIIGLAFVVGVLIGVVFLGFLCTLSWPCV